MSRGRVNDPVPPVDAQHARAAKFPGALHVGLYMAGSELREPHGRIVLKPRNRPALAAAELSEGLADGVPSQSVVERRKNNFFRQADLQNAAQPLPSRRVRASWLGHVS